MSDTQLRAKKIKGGTKKGKKGKKRKLEEMAVDEEEEITSPETKKMRAETTDSSDSDDADSSDSDDEDSDDEDSDDEKEPEERVTGVVTKWVHHKGFGFIKLDDSDLSVFVHATECLNDDDDPTFHRGVKLGSKVEFVVAAKDENAKRGKGAPRATKVTAVGGGKCEHGRMAKGTIAAWHNTTGFIKGDDGKIVYVKEENLWEPSGRMREGDRVEYDMMPPELDGRINALYVTLEGKRAFLCALCGQRGHTQGRCKSIGKKKFRGT